MSKKHITALFLSLILGFSIQAQRNYLLFDYSISQFKILNANTNSLGLSQKLNRCEGNYLGGSYHFAVGRNNSLSIGMGLSKIIYQKFCSWGEYWNLCTVEGGGSLAFRNSEKYYFENCFCCVSKSIRPNSK